MKLRRVWFVLAAVSSVLSGVIFSSSADALLVGGCAVSDIAATSITATVPVTRVAGDNRAETAVQVSQLAFPNQGSAHVVVLARSDAFPDALVGGPLASELGGPLLLTGSASLDPATAAEISRVLPAGATVYVLGSVKAISSPVDTVLTAMGFVTKRLFGANRFETAIAVADALGDPTTIFEATGRTFADALTGSPAAAMTHGAILLTDDATLPPATAAYFNEHVTTKRYALGGPAAKADPSATPLAGADRFETAARVARQFFPAPTRVGVATSDNFPDALAAGPVLAASKAPLLLVPPSGLLPGHVVAELLDEAPTLTGVTVFGGTATLPDDAVKLFGQLASLGVEAQAADAAPQAQEQFGVRTERATIGDAVTCEVIIADAVNDVATVYRDDGTTSTVPGAALTPTEQASMPAGGKALEDWIVAAYHNAWTAEGLSFSSEDAEYTLSGEQVVLNPVISAKLRLAAYAIMANLPSAVVNASASDFMGRRAISITAPNAIYAGDFVAFLLDPATATPLEDQVLTPDGHQVARNTYLTFSRADTMPADPYA